jgi:hypothetical protein
LRTFSDARYFGDSAFALRYAELRSFAAENFQAVENDRELLLARSFLPSQTILELPSEAA